MSFRTSCRLLPARALALVAAFMVAATALAATPGAPADIPVVNGGITKDEADAIKAQAPGYSLEVTLARRGETPGRNEFVADAHLRVIDSAGRVLVDRNDAGPIFLAKLPAGQYTVEATIGGRPQTHKVDVADGRRTQTTFLWE